MLSFSQKNSKIEQGQEQNSGTKDRLVLNDIQQSQQPVYYWEIFVRASCFQLLTAAVLLLGSIFWFLKTLKEKKCGVPNHSGKTVESRQYGLGLGRVFSFPPAEVVPPCMNRPEFPSLPLTLHNTWAQIWSRSWCKHMPTSMHWQIIYSVR